MNRVDRRRAAGLLLILAACGVASFLAPGRRDGSYLTLERADRPKPGGEGIGREIYRRTRSTRPIPWNADLVIRRIAPGSPDGPVDLRHQPWDWVEVYNRSDEARSLDGYSLSDDPGRPRRFRFPNLVVPPRQGLRVWLSGLDIMDSVWSLAPSNLERARGWRIVRDDAMADRFMYLWLGYRRHPEGSGHDPDTYRMQFPVRVAEPGRYGIWLHAAARGDAASRLTIRFEQHELDVTVANREAWGYAPLVHPTSEDGYWPLAAGVHALACAVREGETLLNQVVLARLREPFGHGRQDLHATFKLKQEGEFIGLFNPAGVAIDHLTTPALATGTMATRPVDGKGRLRIQSLSALESGGHRPPLPRLSPGGGVYPVGTRISATCSDAAADVRFTLDGSVPTRNSPRLDTGLALGSNTVFRARAFLRTGRGSRVAEASYWVEKPGALPILSAIIEPEQVHDPSRGMMRNPSIRGLLSERRSHLTWFEPGEAPTAAVGGIRIQGRSSRQTSTKRNFRFVFRDRYGDPVWPGDLFPTGSPRERRSVVAVGRNIVRRQLAHRLMDLADVRSPRRRPFRFFVNGKPFGLYLLMEDIQDPAYLEHEFGHLDLDVIKEKTYSPLKWGGMGNFESEVLREVHAPPHAGSYQALKALFDVDELCRWQAVIQYAGIDDSGQGYYVRDHRAAGPPWTIINWDFDHAFTLGPDHAWGMVQGNRSRLMNAAATTSVTFQENHVFPSYQLMANHLVPHARLPALARKWIATLRAFLGEEYEAHQNQYCFRGPPPDRESFLAARYTERWEQLLHFVDVRHVRLTEAIRAQLVMGEVRFVRLDMGDRWPNLLVDGWPARPSYQGYYREGSGLSIQWKAPDAVRGMTLAINGVSRRVTELRTNVTADLDIRIVEGGEGVPAASETRAQGRAATGLH